MDDIIRDSVWFTPDIKLQQETVWGIVTSCLANEFLIQYCAVRLCHFDLLWFLFYDFPTTFVWTGQNELWEAASAIVQFWPLSVTQRHESIALRDRGVSWQRDGQNWTIFDNCQFCLSHFLHFDWPVETEAIKKLSKSCKKNCHLATVWCAAL